MATLLLSCDQSVKLYNGEYYAKNQELYEFYHRYLRVFEKIKMAVRCENATKYDESWIKLDTDRIEIVYIPNFSGPKQYLKVYYDVGKSIKNITEGCDAAIIRLPSTIGQRVAHKVMKSGMPYAVEIVYDAVDGTSNARSFIERLLWKRIDSDMRKITKCADGVSCVTEKYLQSHYSSHKINVFTTNYSTLSLDNDFYTSPRFFPNKETFSIVHVASQVDCNTRKGHIQLIQILSLLKERNIRVGLTFVGEDYHNGVRGLTELAEKANVLDQIKFVGRVNRRQLSNILECSDIFVFPTAAEGLPRVVIEAMAKGLPCVISDVSGNPELVSKSMLVNYLDIQGFAEKIKLLINNKKLYENISKHNFEKSKCYESSILQMRRDNFYMKLKELINV